MHKPDHKLVVLKIYRGLNFVWQSTIICCKFQFVMSKDQYILACYSFPNSVFHFNAQCGVWFLKWRVRGRVCSVTTVCFVGFVVICEVFKNLYVACVFYTPYGAFLCSIDSHKTYLFYFNRQWSFVLM